MSTRRGIQGVLTVSLVLACQSRSTAQPLPMVPAPEAKADAPGAAGVAAGAPADAPGAAGADAVERYIVGEADAARFYVGHYDAAAAYFTPTEAEVAAFERELPAFLAGVGDPTAKAIAGRLATYRRQFVGVVREEGRRILGNYFCDTTMPASVPVMVDDGGSCYFNVLYDPSRRTFDRMSVNGEG